MRIGQTTLRTPGLLFALALALRIAVALLPSTVDATNFVQSGRLVQQGRNVYVNTSAYNYPPVYGWLLAVDLTIADTFQIPELFAVRLPSIIADAFNTALVYSIVVRRNPMVALRLGLLYAVNPITMLVAAHQGQFDARLTCLRSLQSSYRMRGGRRGQARQCWESARRSRSRHRFWHRHGFPRCIV